MIRSVLVVSALLLSLTACAGDDPASDSASDPASDPAGDTGSASTTPSETSTASPTDDGSPADPQPATTPELLDFTAVTVGGDSFEGADLAGSPTVLWFWAPWCPTCRGQIPQVEQLAADFGGQVDIVGVGSLDSAEAIAGFAGDVDGITHLEDVDGVLWKKFGVAEQSSFVVLDADGEVTFEAGYGGSDDLATEVEKTLG